MTSAQAAGTLADAQAQDAIAQEAVVEAEAALEAARQEAMKADSRGDAALARSEQAEKKAQAIRSDLIKSRLKAKQQVGKADNTYEAAVEKEDHDSATRVGLGLACLYVALAIWQFGRIRRLRVSGAVASIPLTFAAFVWLTALSALGGSGGLQVAAVSIAVGVPLVAIVFATAVFAGRKERSRKKPTEKKVPPWTGRALTVLFFLLFVALAGSGAIKQTPDRPEFSEQTLRMAKDAEGTPDQPASPAVEEAEDKAAELLLAAEGVRDRRRTAHRAIGIANRRLWRARRTARRTSRLVSRRSTAASQPVAPTAPTPSYSSCATAPSNVPVPPGSSLDSDGDGIGCES